jgi:hypothetical protein
VTVIACCVVSSQRYLIPSIKTSLQKSLRQRVTVIVKTSLRKSQQQRLTATRIAVLAIMGNTITRRAGGSTTRRRTGRVMGMEMVMTMVRVKIVVMLKIVVMMMAMGMKIVVEM